MSFGVKRTNPTSRPIVCLMEKPGWRETRELTEWVEALTVRTGSRSGPPHCESILNAVCLRCNVLVAEDSPLVLRLLLRLFDRPLFSVIAREDGLAALKALDDEGPIDLLVADIDMPGITGVELCGQACSPDCWIPTILITGCVPDDVDTTDLPSNVCRLVQKPFGIDTLPETADRIHQARACRAPFAAGAEFA